MTVGCACGSEDGGLDKPDNPFESSGLCCDQATKKTFKVWRCRFTVSTTESKPVLKAPTAHEARI